MKNSAWMQFGSVVLTLGSVFVAPSFVLSQDQSHSNSSLNKSEYTLFNPTPRDLMRDMSTDRPDTTESPYSVDAGHIQLEMSLIGYGYNYDQGARTTILDLAPINLKVGLLNNVDLQFVITPYQRVESEIEREEKVSDGFSDDSQLRLKINFWGNDGGTTAFGFMPFVKFPTGSAELTNDQVEGGLIFPLAITLSGDWSMGFMAETDFVYNPELDNYGVDFVHSGTVSHKISIIENLGGFIEYVGISPHNTGESYQATLDAGITYGIGEDIQLDLGGAVGLTDNADDYRSFAGISFRY